jgi:hypothetical protein
MKYALQGSVLAICFKTGWWIARRGPGSGLSALHEVSGELSEGTLAVTEGGLHDTFVGCVADRPLYREQKSRERCERLQTNAFTSLAAPFVADLDGSGLARLRLELLRSLAVEGLGGLDVCSLLALGASGDVKRYALAFLEGFEAAGVDCRVMREEVLATVFRGDEAKAFCVVKPFHCSACHFDAPDWGRYFATHT